jgi:hypothetical protein
VAQTGMNSSSLNVFDDGDGDVLLRSILWTLSIVSVFCNHNVSIDGCSLVIRCEPTLLDLIDRARD